MEGRSRGGDWRAGRCLRACRFATSCATSRRRATMSSIHERALARRGISSARRWRLDRLTTMREARPCARPPAPLACRLNLTDRPALSDFIMGAIVNRSPLVIGVSTGGAAPVFAQAVRGRIETLVPATFAAWARAAQDWRPLVRASGLDFLARRDFWRRFTRLAFRNIERAPTGRPTARRCSRKRAPARRRRRAAA